MYEAQKGKIANTVHSSYIPYFDPYDNLVLWYNVI